MAPRGYGVGNRSGHGAAGGATAAATRSAATQPLHSLPAAREQQAHTLVWIDQLEAVQVSQRVFDQMVRFRDRRRRLSGAMGLGCGRGGPRASSGVIPGTACSRTRCVFSSDNRWR